MPPSVDIWFLVVSNSTDGMGPCSVIWMYSAVNLRKKLYVTRSQAGLQRLTAHPARQTAVPRMETTTSWPTDMSRLRERGN